MDAVDLGCRLLFSLSSVPNRTRLHPKKCKMFKRNAAFQKEVGANSVHSAAALFKRGSFCDARGVKPCHTKLLELADILHCSAVIGLRLKTTSQPQSNLANALKYLKVLRLL